MAIECYESGCPFHACKVDPEEGPYCFEDECREPHRFTQKEEWPCFCDEACHVCACKEKP